MLMTDEIQRAGVQLVDDHRAVGFGARFFARPLLNLQFAFVERGIHGNRFSLPCSGRREKAGPTRVWMVRLLYVLCEEVANVLRDKRAVLFQGKVPSVEQV